MLLSTHSSRRERVQNTYLLWGYIDADFYARTLTTFLLNNFNIPKSSRFGGLDYIMFKKKTWTQTNSSVRLTACLYTLDNFEFSPSLLLEARRIRNKTIWVSKWSLTSSIGSLLSLFRNSKIWSKDHFLVFFPFLKEEKNIKFWIFYHEVSRNLTLKSNSPAQSKGHLRAPLETVKKKFYFHSLPRFSRRLKISNYWDRTSTWGIF